MTREAQPISAAGLALTEVAAKRTASKGAAGRHLELCADRVARRLAGSTLGASAAQHAVGADERLLDRVLAVLAAAERMAAEREQRAVMPVVERREGRSVPGVHEGRKPLVIEPVVSHTSETPCRAVYSLRGLRN